MKQRPTMNRLLPFHPAVPPVLLRQRQGRRQRPGGQAGDAARLAGHRDEHQEPRPDPRARDAQDRRDLHRARAAGWQFNTLRPILGPVFQPLFGMPFKREFCSICRDDFPADFGSLYIYIFLKWHLGLGPVFGPMLLGPKKY